MDNVTFTVVERSRLWHVFMVLDTGYTDEVARFNDRSVAEQWAKELQEWRDNPNPQDHPGPR